MPASVTKQLPPAHSHEFVAGNPYTFTVTATGATITAPAITLKSGAGDPFTTDPGVPTVTQVGNLTRVAFSVADSAALNPTTRARNFIYSLQALVDGDGPHELVARQIVVHPVGAAISTQSQNPINLDVVIGGVEIALEISLSAGKLLGSFLGGVDDDDNPTVSIVFSPWGIDSNGDPYYDPDGAVSGEEALLTFAVDGTPILIQVGS